MSYPPDPLFRASVIKLLGGIWKKLPPGIAAAESLGADWFSGSTPFVHWEDGQVVAHTGVLEIPLWLCGRPVAAAGIHAVCTHPQYRGRGYLRQTFLRALRFIDQRRYDLAVLWANDPAIYTRFGFIRCPESVFHGPVAPPATGVTSRRAAASPLRRLSLQRADDVEVLRARFGTRVPVSPRCGTVEPGWLALIDLSLWPQPLPELALSAELDCVIVYARRGRTLHLYDVIAKAMPSLSALVAATDGVAAGATPGTTPDAPGAAPDGPADSVVVYFSPEALAAPQLVPGPTPLGDFLMARGPKADPDPRPDLRPDPRPDPRSDAGAQLAALQPLAFSPLMRC